MEQEIDLEDTGNFGKHTYTPPYEKGKVQFKEAGSAQSSRKCPARMWPFKKHKPRTSWRIEWEYEGVPSFAAGTMCSYCGEKF